MRTDQSLIIVEGFVPSDPLGPDLDNVREHVLDLALDQRAFGPRKLLVAFAERDGRLRGLAITDRDEPIDLPFQACLEYLGAGAAAAVAYLDERVEAGEPTPEFIARFERLAATAAGFGIVLVDWISCDDEEFRPVRLLHAESDDDWWNL